ncbi:LOW QUALITY PROTEIN: DNA topoisomerase I, mitochondrial-like [Macrobrachium rosenbergii]|uniref:LOW QUALITY PROTEIN: DNA topoisomerase I, mitochondrial-like n=1 Tax=Macrobrachium rosenbergii TaxID=79674 RepID=UPI0034D68D08
MSDSEMLSVPSGGVDGLTNGISNGISNDTSEHREHKEHKHKHKDKDRDREKDRHRDKDRHKSSHKDKDRDKDRDKDERSSHKSSHKDKEHKDRDDKHRDRDKDKDKHRDSDRDKHKHRESSDKDKERRRRDKERERSDKDKHRDKDKSREKSDRDKERSDKDKSKHRDEKRHSSSNEERKDRDKDRHSSSHKSSHKDKHRDKDRDKDRHRDKERNHEREKVKAEVKEEPVEMEIPTEAPLPMEDVAVKEEPMESEEEDKLVINEPVKEEPQEEDEEEDDIPLVSRVKQEQHEDEGGEDEDEDEDDEDDDDVPLSARKRMRQEVDDDDEDDKPLSFRIKGKKPDAKEKKRKKNREEDDDDEDFKPEKKKVKKEKEKKPKKPKATKVLASPIKSESPTKKTKKEEEPVWRWWEETKRDDDLKWTFLEHRGPKMADSYEQLPGNVRLYYEGQPLDLSDTTEEIAGFYARMLDHEYTTKEVFNSNFFKDWRKSMTPKEKEIITDLKKCDFRRIHAYYVQKNEERKNRTKEEKKALKEKNEEIVKEYGWCTIDGHRQRIGNFKVEPPGLFRGRGEHPKQGMVKRRTMPEDIIINCSKDSVIPRPPDGHKWKEVRCDPKVTWLACWVENIQGQTKYVMLNAASKLKGEKDWQKYETARRLHQIVDRIREQYRLDFKSKEMKVRQRAVALYFIDKLALRAGNEKDEDQADTVGCCSLRVEHITLHEEKDGKEYVVAFDFLGKDSIRYLNEVAVEKRVFKNLQLFMENKQDGDDLFDRLNTQILNKHLNELMEGLTAKVFRTYNASRTLQEQLEEMTNPDDPIPAKILAYNRANRAVAILCNHQRAAPKTFDKSMANLQKKIDDKREIVDEAERELKKLKKQAKSGGTQKERILYEKKKKAVERLREQLEKLELSATDKEENKTIALGTSKLNYLDPRISVAWCKKYNVPVEKIFNKTHRAKFQWAIDMATAEYNFMGEPMDISRTGNNDDEEEEEDE